MSHGKFSVFTLSYVNTALNQQEFRIHKCYIIIAFYIYSFRPNHIDNQLILFTSPENIYNKELGTF